MIREISGFRVGFIYAVCAAQGPDSILHPERIQQAIKQMREQCDAIIMLVYGVDCHPRTDAGIHALLEPLWGYGADIVILNASRPMLPFVLDGNRFAVGGLGTFLCLEPSQTNPSLESCDMFSAVLNLTLERKDGKVTKHLSFRLCQTWYEAQTDTVPKVADTYDRWSECPSDHYRELILDYANRWMPNMLYKEPMAEYPIGYL